MIQNSLKSIEGIKGEIYHIEVLWTQIDFLLSKFKGYMDTKWIDTDPFEMEEEVKRQQKTLKEMKVDKKCNAYLGIQDEVKKWLVFLPLIAELRDDAMRDRHWKMIKDKV